MSLLFFFCLTYQFPRRLHCLCLAPETVLLGAHILCLLHLLLLLSRCIILFQAYTEGGKRIKPTLRNLSSSFNNSWFTLISFIPHKVFQISPTGLF